VFLTDGGVNKLQAAPRGGWRQLDGTEDEASWHSGGGTGSQHGSAYSGSMHGGSMHGGSMHGGSMHGGSMHGGSMHGGSMHGGSMHGGSMHGGSMHGHGGSIHGADRRSSVHSVSSGGTLSPNIRPFSGLVSPFLTLLL
jgi:hypothetical protein